MITEAAIRSAIKAAGVPGAGPKEIKDDGDRGAGRLALVVRQMRTKVSAEWYAVYYWGGKRKMDKIGSYPTMGLADARKVFRSDFSPAITAGKLPEAMHARKRRDKEEGNGTVKELFEAYVESLAKDGKPQPTIDQVSRILLGTQSSNVERRMKRLFKSVVDALGPDTLARDVDPGQISEHLAEIYRRGSTSQADKTRAYVSAAYTNVMQAKYDYTGTSRAGSWGLKSNPVAAIPADPNASKPGDRHLGPKEFRLFWKWLEARDAETRLSPVLRLQLATGQRTTEILRLGPAFWDRAQRMLEWPTTKNKLPHSVPICQHAFDIIELLIPNKHGLYFPHRDYPDKPAAYISLRPLCDLFVERAGIERFTRRDIRRTWKTLAGRAGIDKDMRDRLPNHAMRDVSSKHYDRYDYLPERREAVAKWETFLTRMLTGELDGDAITTTEIEQAMFEDAHEAPGA